MTNTADSPAKELREAILTGEPVRRGNGEPAEQGHSWGEERSLPASELYELLVWPESGTTPRVAILEGLRITGRLDLRAADLKVPLICQGCYFDEPVNLMIATAVEIRLITCWLPGLAADQLITRRDLELSRSMLGVVGLADAHIGGRLLLSGATLSSGSYPLDLGHSSLYPRESSDHTRTEVSLVADGLKVDGNMLCEEGFSAQGEVWLPGAHIAGQLGFNSAKLGKGLTAYWLTVDRGMFCEEGFSAQGKVWLSGAHIAGHLGFEKAMLGGALTADRLKVDGDMFCGKGFSAQGEVDLRGARITGQLVFLDDEAKPDKVGAFTLSLSDAHIDDGLILCVAEGFADEIDLTNARIGRLLDFECTWPQRLRLGGLVYASVRAIEDHVGTYEHGEGWREIQRWRPGRAAPDVARRLRWIRRAEESSGNESSTRGGYMPQPYTQLMAYYRKEGRDGDARRVAYERERRRWHQLGKAGKVWNGFLRWTVGYGYRPLRALVLLLALLSVGTVAFSHFHTAHEIIPMKAAHPPFDAIIYTLDRLTPIVSFGLRDAYAPTGAAQWWAVSYALLGWALSIAIIAGLNAAVRREN
ncbi:MAG TPA: hypothetical protein VFF79_05255 [Conexibacter sp.]|jgi:hypothetical protein|nr:hypothetical protein [Conexibacter sp.]